MRFSSYQQDRRKRTEFCLGISVFIVLVFLSTLAATASAQTCTNYDNSMHWQGGVSCEEAYNGNLSVDFPYVYLSTWDHGLWAFDVSDPANPESQKISSLSGRKLWKQGNLALMDRASFEDPPGWPYFRQLVAMECSDPLNPIARDSMVIAPNILDVEYYGDVAMVAADDSGLVFLDISDLDNLQVLHKWGSDKRVYSVEIRDALAYVGTGRGLFILDLNNPLEPDVVGYVGGDHQLVSHDGNHLVTGNGYQNRLYDVRDPLNPVLVEEIEEYSLGRPDIVDGILLQLRIHGVSITPLQGTGQFQETTFVGYFRSSVMHDGMLYALSRSGLDILDLAGGKVPEPVAMVSSTLIVKDVSFRDGYAFLAADNSGLRIFDMATQDDVTYQELDGDYSEIELMGELAILAGYEIFSIMDISSPEETSFVSTLTNLPMAAMDMELQGSKAWVLVYPGDSALGFDFSDPFQIQQESSLVLPEDTVDMAIDNNLMYVVGSSENTLQVFDLAVEPPTLLASFDLEGPGLSIAVEGGIAAVSGEDGKITLLNIDDPTSLELLTSIRSYAAGQVVLQDNILSVSSKYCLQLFDLNQTDSPQHLGEFWMTNKGHLMTPSGEFLLWGQMENSLALVSGPCGTLPFISKLEETEKNILEVGPNPFNPRTTLNFMLPQNSFCSLVIHDLRGYEVQTLCAEELTEGTHRFVWQGRDNSGKSVPSGLYLARLEYSGGVQIRKLALVR